MLFLNMIQIKVYLILLKFKYFIDQLWYFQGIKYKINKLLFLISISLGDTKTEHHISEVKLFSVMA